jgi:hypothetical protein
MADRHCAACGAHRPALVAAQDAEEPLAMAEPPAEESGDLLGGLRKLVRAAAGGALKPHDFAQRMRSSVPAVDEAFDGIQAELESLPAGDEDYAGTVASSLQDARSLFHLALAELEVFGVEPHEAHLRLGMLLAEKGQEQYLRLLGTVREDAAGHPYAGQSDVVRRLAGEVLEGRLSLEVYREQLEEIAREAGSLLDQGRLKLAEGLGLATRFGGASRAQVDEAALLLDEGTELLGRVVLMFHDADAARRAARDILEGSVDD